MVQSWKGVVIYSNDRRCQVRLMHAFRGPLKEFEAEHIISENDGNVVIRDFFECEFSDAEAEIQENLWKDVDLFHGFEERELVANRFAERKTGSMDTFPESQTAG